MNIKCIWRIGSVPGCEQCKGSGGNDTGRAPWSQLRKNIRCLLIIYLFKKYALSIYYVLDNVTRPVPTSSSLPYELTIILLLALG